MRENSPDLPAASLAVSAVTFSVVFPSGPTQF
jgi:hypothetical protein